MSAIKSSTAAATPSPTATGNPSRTGLAWWQAALLAAVTATALNLAIWGVARIAGAQLALPDDGAPYPITADSVAFMSAVPMLAGIALAALIARWWTGVLRMAQLVGALLAVGTVWGVFGGDTGTALALTSMHLVSGAVVVLSLEGVRRRVLADKNRK